MNTLDDAIKAAKGVTPLAKALGIRPNTISNWQKRGAPKSWLQLLDVMRLHRIGVYSDITSVTSQPSMAKDGQMASPL